MGGGGKKSEGKKIGPERGKVVIVGGERNWELGGGLGRVEAVHTRTRGRVPGQLCDLRYGASTAGFAAQSSWGKVDCEYSQQTNITAEVQWGAAARQVNRRSHPSNLSLSLSQWPSGSPELAPVL